MAKSIVVSIEFFGFQRSVTGIDAIDMPINGETRVNDALEYIRNQYPGLHLEEGTVLITVNQEIASLDRVLEADDNVLFLPYISGG